MKLLTFVLLFAGLVSARSSYAFSVKGVADLGAEFGGDTLVTVTFVGGTTQTVQAGKGLVMAAGADFGLLDQGTHLVDLQATLGYKITMMAPATNGSLEWSSIPLDVLAFYQYSPVPVRLGFGVTYRMSPSLQGTGLTSILAPVDNALGYVVEADYLAGPKFMIGLKYAAVNYTFTGTGTTVNGSSFGGSFGFFF